MPWCRAYGGGRRSSLVTAGRPRRCRACGEVCSPSFEPIAPASNSTKRQVRRLAAWIGGGRCAPAARATMATDRPRPARRGRGRRPLRRTDRRARLTSRASTGERASSLPSWCSRPRLVDRRRTLVSGGSQLERREPGPQIALVAGNPDPVLEAAPERRRLGIVLQQVEHGLAGIGQVAAPAARSSGQRSTGLQPPVITTGRARGSGSSTLTAFSPRTPHWRFWVCSATTCRTWPTGRLSGRGDAASLQAGVGHGDVRVEPRRRGGDRVDREPGALAGRSFSVRYAATRWRTPANDSSTSLVAGSSFCRRAASGSTARGSRRRWRGRRTRRPGGRRPRVEVLRLGEVLADERRADDLAVLVLDEGSVGPVAERDLADAGDERAGRRSRAGG